MHPVQRMLVFAEVVRRGTFTSAAKSLGLSKSSVSHQVAELERELDTQLLVRTTRRMTLTHAGERLAKHCVRIRDHADHAMEELDEHRAEPEGVLSATAPHAFGETVLLG